MRPWHAVIVLMVLVGCAVATSRHGYNCAKEDIIADMNQALARTLAEKTEGWITPDTIADYRSFLKIAALRRSSVIYYAIDEQHDDLKSRRMTWHDGRGRRLVFRGYANCSLATVWGMSDQRPAMLLTLAAMLWALASAIYFRRLHRGMIVLGGLVMDCERQRFLTLGHEPVTMTPMQEKLMGMFFRADGHRLGKQQICDVLWPKKPDASDTLYTLIRRIKPILADKGLAIETQRGKDYRLKVSDGRAAK